jgi:sensor c-di-GMP phosphodiesterase-like protein
MIDLSAIKAGLENQEFFLEYLPTISLRDDRCVGCEALIRWQRADGVVPPLEFIPLIDNTLLSATVTYLVIDTLGRELGAWLREYADVHISVNVAPGMLGHAGLMSAIGNSNLLDVIEQLVVEVTERGVPKSINGVANGIRGDGRARIALDDTALTAASLVTLSQSRIDIVKIDKPFIDQLLDDNCPKDKLAALSQLLDAKNHIVVAEGVESAAQVARLKQLGVDMAQGWHFSKPLSAQKFLKFFAARR